MLTQDRKESRLIKLDGGQSAAIILGLLIMVSICLLMGCATTRVVAFKDPALANASYSTPAVYANTKDLQWRMALEDSLVSSMNKIGIPAKAMSQMILPTNESTPEEMAEILRTNGIDSLIIIEMGEAGINQVYIPPTSATTTTSGTMITSGSVSTYQGRSQTNLTGGQNYSVPWAKITTYVLDVSSGSKVWVASSTTEGNMLAQRFEDVQKSYCKKILQELLDDKVVVSSKSKK